MGALVVGPGTRDGVDVGPLIDRTGRAKVEDLVDDAVERGARVLVGGRTPEGPGCFYPPTVLADVAPDSRADGHGDLRPGRARSSPSTTRTR